MRVGVVGVGAMGQNHARVYAELATLVGVCDADTKTGQEVAKRFSSQYYADLEEFLSLDLDAISVSTPTSEHFEIASRCIDKGTHTLLEKPFCGNVEMAQQLTRKARERGVVLAAGMVERHNPCVSFAHDALKAGRYGKVIAASSRRVSSFPTRIRDVGAMMDLGIHDVDVMRFLVGDAVTSAYSVGGREQHEMFEDNATAVLTFAGGATGTVEVNWLTPMKVRRLSLTCLENFEELDYINQTVDISSSTLMEYDPSNLFQPPFEYDVRRVALKKQEPLRRELQDFLGSAKSGRDPLVSGEEAVKTLKVVAAIMESHATGQPVRVS